MLDNYTVETAPLFKMLGFETFRFIIVRYNHYSLVSKIQSDLQQLFPQRPTKKLDAQKIDYQSLTKTYYALEKGFLFLENFEILLKKKLDSQNRETPEIALENKRKTDILAGLNLRRDTLAKYPIALMVFVSSSADELYARTIMEQMPDMWSFRSMILDLHTNMDGEPKPITDPLPRTEDNTTIISQDLSELHHLLDLLNNAPESEQAYRLTLYPQIVKTAMDTGIYEKAYEILETWEHQIHENDTLKVWLHKADILKTYSNLHDALELLEKARKLSITRADTYNEGIFCQRIGDVHILLGNTARALEYFEKYLELTKELYDSYPRNVDFKNGLAISYSKLGQTHSTLGNTARALEYFEKYLELTKELYDSYPRNVDFKNGLAISYSKLGDTHSTLGNTARALEYFEKYLELTKELYDSYPRNVDFKNGLAISYSKLGQTHSTLGNTARALEYFEKDLELTKELHDSYPRNVDFKNGLAISYSKLGDTHSTLGNTARALEYFENASILWQELVKQAPDYVQFQKNLEWVRNEMNRCKEMFF